MGKQTSRRGSWEKNLQTNVWKLKKIRSATYRKATSFKLRECNLLPSILTFWFTNCEKVNFGRSYLLSDSHTNTNFWPLCLPDKMASKTVIRPIRWDIRQWPHGNFSQPEQFLRATCNFFKASTIKNLPSFRYNYLPDWNITDSI